MVDAKKKWFCSLLKTYFVSTIILLGFPPVTGLADDISHLKQKATIIAPLASRSLLVNITLAHGRWFVVGERGHILYSDNGVDWSQARTPTQNLITAVFFINGKQGWAVGHDAVILYTEDRGETWNLQYSDPESETPLMDVFFFDDKKGLSVGAYGLVLVTEDGGQTWEAKSVDEEMDRHLNALFNFNNELYMVGESGVVYRSEDQGNTWIKIELPYSGSLFGVSSLSNKELLVFGLQGNAFSSTDRGQSWEKIDIPINGSLFGHALYKNGCSVIVGKGGILLRKCPGQNEYQDLRYPNFNDLVDVFYMDEKNLLLVGEKGVEKFSISGN